MKNSKLKPYQEELLNGLRKGALTHVHMSRGTGKSRVAEAIRRHLPNREWGEWCAKTSILPRKSVNGRWIFGLMYERDRTVRRMTATKGGGAMMPHTERQYATKKELFELKLKGKE